MSEAGVCLGCLKNSEAACGGGTMRKRKRNRGEVREVAGAKLCRAK